MTEKYTYDPNEPDAEIGMSEEDLAAFIEAGRHSVGRPSLTGESRHSPQISFRVPDQVRAKAEETAAREGVTVSQVARKALEEYLTSH